MIVLDNGPSRFQFRTAALIRHEDHFLIHRSTREPFWTLPGGRVELHEPTAEALAREMVEELGSDCTVGPLRVVIENFFEYGGQLAHELGFFFEVGLHTPPPFQPDVIVHRCRDGATDLEFRWVAAEELGTLDLKPTALLPLLKDPLPTFTHLVHQD